MDRHDVQEYEQVMLPKPEFDDEPQLEPMPEGEEIDPLDEGISFCEGVWEFMI